MAAIIDPPQASYDPLTDVIVTVFAGLIPDTEYVLEIRSSVTGAIDTLGTQMSDGSGFAEWTGVTIQALWTVEPSPYFFRVIDVDTSTDMQDSDTFTINVDPPAAGGNKLIGSRVW
jgi:hypothetical protein